MYSRSIHRLLVGIGGLGALALLVPSLALGGVVLNDETGLSAHVTAAYVSSHQASIANLLRPDDRSGPLGAQPPTAASTRSVAVTAVRPDNRAGELGAQPIVADTSSGTTSLRPDDRSGPLGASPITSTQSAAVSLPASVSDSGFQWRDAAVGAASMLALFMIALVAVTLQRQHRRGVVAH
jgi:hypothetical protein